MVDNSNVPLACSVAFFAASMCGDEVCVLTLEGLGGLCAGSDDEVLEIDTCLTTVVRQADLQVFEARNPLAGNWKVQKPL